MSDLKVWMPHGKEWMPPEKEFLRDYRNRPARWCAEQLGRTEGAVHHQRGVLGLRGSAAKPIRFNAWTPVEDKLVLSASPMPEKHRRGGSGQSEFQKVADQIGRTYAAVRSRRYKLIEARRTA